MHIFLIALLFFANVLAAESISFLSFQKLHGLPDHLPQDSAIKHLERNLAEHSHQKVRVRGFPYKKAEQWILASAPNIKTCCLEKINIAQQIVLKNFSENLSDKAVTIEGTFLIQPQWDSSGNLIQLYAMDDPKLVEEPQNLPTFLLGGIGFAGLLFIWKFSKNKKMHESE